MSDLDDLTDAVNDLTRSRINKEPFAVLEGGKRVTKTHDTDVPSLLDQLQEALEPGGTGDTGRAPFGSRAAARIDAMDVFMRIDQAVYGWVKTYAEDRRWDSTTDKLRALVGVATRMDRDDLHELTREARRWVTAARVCTGWEVPAMQPRNTCPLCAEKGTLRVRVGDGITSNSATAVCLGCFETWNDSNIGLLAEHIRSENGDESLYAGGAA